MPTPQNGEKRDSNSQLLAHTTSRSNARLLRILNEALSVVTFARDPRSPRATIRDTQAFGDNRVRF